MTAAAIISRYDHAQVQAWLEKRGGPAARGRWHETLRGAIIVAHSARLPGGIVAIGSPFELRDLATGTNQRVRLVPPHGKDGAIKAIPVLSPLGERLLGRAEGDIVTCRMPDGVRRLRIGRVFPDALAIAAAAL